MRVPLSWLKEFVDFKASADELSSALTMGGIEVEKIEKIDGETVFELSITPNRSDCLSIIGVAREVSALFGKKFSMPKLKNVQGKGKMSDFVKIFIRDAKGCPRYAARVVDGVTIGPSPNWVVKKLSLAGVRSINNVVDATNLVMIETGQPTHAFDLRFVGDGKIEVKKATVGKTFKTLDGISRTLSADDLLICDGQGPVALAGVMGGENSEVRHDTGTILLECAYFDPVTVRKTSRRLGLVSESSRRFERSVDPNGTISVLDRLTALIVEIAGGNPTNDHVDIYPKKIMPRKLSISQSEVKRILGADVSPKEIKEILTGLGLVSVHGSKTLSFTVPTFRMDLEREIDLIEEIARIHGYDKITDGMPKIEMQSIRRLSHSATESSVRNTLVGCGMSETVLYGFTSEASVSYFDAARKNAIHIDNPLSAEQGVMRTTLITGLLDVLKLNLSRQRKDVSIFAMQNVFMKNAVDLTKSTKRMLAGLISGRVYWDFWEHSSVAADFFDIKGVCESVMSSLKLEAKFSSDGNLTFLHPGKSASVICEEKKVGFVGELHPDISGKWDAENVFVFELDLDLLAEISEKASIKYKDISKYPFVERDIALIVSDEVSSEDIIESVLKNGGGILTGARIFDVYKGKGIPAGQKSIAATLKFEGKDRTLTDEEVVGVQSKIVNVLKNSFGAQLRA